ncbi:MAG: hypothetical protein ACYDEX_23990 [Mobilitalea sp.]
MLELFKGEIMQYENIIIWYENAINDLKEILKIVPYNNTNCQVIIPKLASIIVECGSLLDTICLSLYSGEKDKPNIKDFKILYEEKFKLSQIKALIYTEELTILQPFESWENPRIKATTFWWEGYNKLKHDRNDSMNYSTLVNAINIISALSIFLARNNELFEVLYRHDLIKSNYNPNFLKQEYEKIWNNSNAECSLENNLLIVPFGKDVLNLENGTINTYRINSDKLRKYFAKWG